MTESITDQKEPVVTPEPPPPKRKWHQRLLDSVGEALGTWFESR